MTSPYTNWNRDTPPTRFAGEITFSTDDDGGIHAHCGEPGCDWQTGTHRVEALHELAAMDGEDPMDLVRLEAFYTCVAHGAQTHAAVKVVYP